MRGARYDQFGEPADVLRVEDLPTPSAGPGQVLVRMRLRPVNPSDLLTIRGFYGELPDLPATPGNEGVGVVEAVGADVRGVEVGQRVIPVSTPGTWQELLVVQASNLVHPPPSISDESAAQFFINPLWALIMLDKELALQPGDWLLQTAAGSTLGRVVLQLAKVRKIRTINVVRRREQAAELKALGADEVICTDDEDLAKRVMAITNGAGVPAAIEAVGGAVGGSVAQVLAPGGVMLVYGMLSLEHMPINGGQMVWASSSLRGFWLANRFRPLPASEQQALISEVLDLMAGGDIVPPVDATYELGDLAKAVRHAETSGRQGKVLLSS